VLIIFRVQQTVGSSIPTATHLQHLAHSVLTKMTLMAAITAIRGGKNASGHSL
jgi:hypothetical protein